MGYNLLLFWFFVCLFFLTRYTSKPEKKLVYAIFLKWPISGKLFLGQPIGSLGETEVRMNFILTVPLN